MQFEVAIKCVSIGEDRFSVVFFDTPIDNRSKDVARCFCRVIFSMICIRNCLVTTISIDLNHNRCLDGVNARRTGMGPQGPFQESTLVLCSVTD